jgi:hypothetical protein
LGTYSDLKISLVDCFCLPPTPPPKA